MAQGNPGQRKQETEAEERGPGAAERCGARCCRVEGKQCPVLQKQEASEGRVLRGPLREHGP